MTITAKRAFYLLAFMAFIILGPMALLYAWGYRYDFIQHKVEITGLIYLKSYPRRATVFLNNQLIANSTPVQLTSLTPGEYDIKIVNDTMWPWQKTVTVVAQRATFLEDIVLFKNLPESALTLASDKILTLSSSPDRGFMAVVKSSPLGSGYQLDILDSGNQQLIGNYLLPPILAPYQLVWGNNSRRLAVMGDKQALAIVLGNPRNPIVISPPATLANNKWRQLSWDLYDDNALLAATAKGLWQFNLSTRAWQNVNSQPLLNLLPQYNQNNLSLIATSSSVWLTPWPINSQNWKLALSSSTNAGFSGQIGPDGLITVQQGTSTTWLITTTTTVPQIINQWSGPTQLAWSPLGNVLAVLNNNKITLINFTDNWQDKITMTDTQPIVDFKWYPGGTHLYLAQAGKLSIIEIDPRGQRNTNDLLVNQSFSGQFITSRSNAELYWVKSSTTTSTINGLYSLIVQ